MNANIILDTLQINNTDTMDEAKANVIVVKGGGSPAPSGGGGISVKEFKPKNIIQALKSVIVNAYGELIES